jgi:cytochrome c oxidase subunit 2
MNELFRRLLDLPEQASSVARGIDLLHYVVISTAILGATAITAIIGLLLLRFRRRPGGTPAALHRRRIPVWIEGAVIAGLLSMFVAFWIVGFRQYVHVRTPPRDAMDVYVVAKQWMWTFAYPDGNASEGDLYVPVGRPVRLLMTSRDVIHSFYVPAFRVKQDVLPGRTTSLWFEATEPGTYDLFCAEYCGTEHSYMHGRVIVLDDTAYARWAEARPRGADLVSTGERVASERGCLRCHTVDGTSHLGPSWAGVFDTLVEMTDGTRIRADEAYLTESMMDPERHIRAGFEPIMPSYRGLLDAGEVAAIVHFIKSLPAHPARTAPPPQQPVRLP